MNQHLLAFLFITLVLGLNGCASLEKQVLKTYMGQPLWLKISLSVDGYFENADPPKIAMHPLGRPIKQIGAGTKVELKAWLKPDQIRIALVDQPSSVYDLILSDHEMLFFTRYQKSSKYKWKKDFLRSISLFLSLANMEEVLKSFPPRIQKAIEAREVAQGMTDQQVIMSVGWPQQIQIWDAQEIFETWIYQTPLELVGKIDFQDKRVVRFNMEKLFVW